MRAKRADFPASGEGRNRTGDTTVFSRVLYRLSYLARGRTVYRCLNGRPDRSEALDEGVDELVLHEDRVRTRFRYGSVQGRMCVAGEGDDTHARMVAAKPRDGADSVEPRHVEVDDDRIGRKLVGELDGGKPVTGSADDCQLRLPLDQRREGIEEQRIVVREQNPDGAGRSGLPHEAGS
jgi:hypothetical protein